jgi:Putative transposase/Transposase zinc-binding domain
MPRTPHDLGDIARRFRSDLEAAESLTPVQGRALSAIGLCRTAALGGHQCVCLDCGQQEDPSYNSCRNRNCPKCQGLAQERWIAARSRAILPIPHFHAVFTLPAQLRPLARSHPAAIYDLMFRCVAATVLEMGQARLGITLGLTMVLHTWTRKLTYHVHLHVLVTAGGLTRDGEAFNAVGEKFLLHVKPLARLFKGKLMDGLRDLRKAGVIPMADGAFGSLMATLWKLDWHVYLKEAFKAPEWVLEYLGRYTHRVGIANSRLLEVTPDRITFRTKGGGRETVHPVEFLRRFVQHVLPDRFKKIRHAGLYGSPKALAKAKEHLHAAPRIEAPERTWQEHLHELSGRDVTRCRACGGLLYPNRLPPTLESLGRKSGRSSRSPP